MGKTTHTNRVPSRSMVALRFCACLIVITMVLSGCASQRDRLSSSIGKRVNLKLPENDSSFINRWYAGVSLGSSDLEPELSEVGFSLQEGRTVGTQMTLGYDLHNLFSVEFDTSVLGSAELEATAEVEYTSLSASGIIYGLNGRSNRSRREKWSGFARLGYSFSTAASNVQVLDGRDLSGAIIGLGVEYGMANGIGLRMEATRFHDEAMLVGFGAVYRFGSKAKGRPAIFAKKKRIEDSPEYLAGEAVAQVADEPALLAGLPGVLQQGKNPAVDTSLTPRAPAAQGQQYLSKIVVATVKDLDGDGVSNEADECADTRPGTSVDAQGCGLFDGVIEGVTFENGSAGLNSTSKRILDRLAIRLMAFPEVRVEVQAHSDEKGPASINKSVSETRANAVARYLQRHGVDPKQLEAVGVGEARPRSEDDTEYGRLANRRIELKTLPDLDIVPRHVTLVQPAAAVTTHQINSSAGSAVTALSTAKRSNKVATTRKKQAAASSEPSLAAAKAQKSPINVLPAPVDLPGFSLNGVLEGVEFEGRSDKISRNSSDALRKVLSGLQKHPSARIAIMAHTDNQGTEDENLDLSARQAKAISAYLIDQGIDRNRLEIEGYGASLPVVQNISEADRERNRRIELRVISK